MSDSKEYVYLMDNGLFEKCEIDRKTSCYTFIKRGDSEYKIHKSNENADYYISRNGQWHSLYFYKPTPELDRRFKKHIIVRKLIKIGSDIYHHKGPIGDGDVFSMIQRMSEFISVVELNKELFQETEDKHE
jgi:hypothetical protein